MCKTFDFLNFLVFTGFPWFPLEFYVFGTFLHIIYAGGKLARTLKGPYPVVKVDPEAGQVIVKMTGQDRPNRIGDVRHTLFVFITWFLGSGPPGQVANVVPNFIAELQAGKFEGFWHGECSRWA